MSIELTRRDEFAVIRIDRAAALNALNYEMLRAIGRALDQVESSDARAVFFIGAGTSYLMDVLTAGSRGRAGTTPDWKLLVLEDAGELLAADAHVRTGQALSRLLNVTDGLVGQAMTSC